MKCPKCGNTCKTDSIYCCCCGTQLQELPPEIAAIVQSRTEEERMNPMPVIDKRALQSEAEIIQKHISRRIALYCFRHRISKTKFAKECGVSRLLIHSIKRGTANPTLDQLKQLANHMEISVSELVNGD